MISNSGSDERGKYSGGAAGDQTGKEWQIINWYSRPWKCILRHPDPKVREAIASNAEKAAKNNNIGYDQGQRTTYYTQLKAAGWDPSKIKVKCEGDCSAGVIANTIAAGYQTGDKKLQALSPSGYTGNMRKTFKAAGFSVLTASKYLTSDQYLLRGDILLNDGVHTATNLTNGSKSGSASGGSSSSGSMSSSAASSTLNKIPKKNGTITGCGALNVRSWAGVENPTCSFSPLKAGTVVGICDTMKGKNKEGKMVDWYYIKVDGKYGFAVASFIK